MLITAVEGAPRHLDDIRARPGEFDPNTRDLFLAGALVPLELYEQAQRFRVWYRDRLRELFADVDVLVAPATPCAAPPLDPDPRLVIGGQVVNRGYLGVFTQPLSFTGLPVVAVPVAGAGPLPLGVQLAAAPFRESAALCVAAALEAAGIARASVS